MSKPDFTQRSTQAELMDSETVPFAEFDECLRQLRIINILTFAYPPTLRWLRQLYKSGAVQHDTTILDVGSGHGDMLRQIDKWGQAHTLALNLIGVDLNPQAKQSAERIKPERANVNYHTGNVFSYAPERQIDFIISALFTHHLDNTQLIEFIRWMDQRATRGWLINDLHRHPIAYYFIKYVTRWLRCNRLICHDAPVSVARAFTAREWRHFMQQAGTAPERVCIRWHFPFRYSISCNQR